ncbi:hypothetical protein SynA18461_01924 [Synechococcus sp. A18-46.1]|nr:hypothetical protein SynA18461_01924 [Synechococcus sp. A18-46.1]
MKKDPSLPKKEGSKNTKNLSPLFISSTLKKTYAFSIKRKEYQHPFHRG